MTPPVSGGMAVLSSLMASNWKFGAAAVMDVARAAVDGYKREKWMQRAAAAHEPRSGS